MSGISDLPGICAELLRAGFSGWWEVEVLSDALWSGDQIALVRASYDAAVAVVDEALALVDGAADHEELLR